MAHGLPRRFLALCRAARARGYCLRFPMLRQKLIAWRWPIGPGFSRGRQRGSRAYNDVKQSLTGDARPRFRLCSRSRCGAREAMTVGCKPTKQSMTTSALLLLSDVVRPSVRRESPRFKIAGGCARRTMLLKQRSRSDADGNLKRSRAAQHCRIARMQGTWHI